MRWLVGLLRMIAGSQTGTLLSRVAQALDSRASRSASRLASRLLRPCSVRSGNRFGSCGLFCNPQSPIPNPKYLKESVSAQALSVGHLAILPEWRRSFISGLNVGKRLCLITQASRGSSILNAIEHLKIAQLIGPCSGHNFFGCHDWNWLIERRCVVECDAAPTFGQ